MSLHYSVSFKPSVLRFLLLPSGKHGAHGENRRCHTNLPLMPWNLWVHLHRYRPLLYSKAWKNCFILCSIPLLPLKEVVESSIKTKPLTSLSCWFLFHLLLLFSDKLWKQALILLVCILLLLTHFAGHSRLTWTLPVTQNPLMPRSQVTTRCRTVFFLLWPISSIWYLFDQTLLEITACWDTIFVWFLFYFSSHISSFSFFAASFKCCSSTGICRKQLLLFPFSADFPGIISTFIASVTIYMLISPKFLLSA